MQITPVESLYLIPSPLSPHLQRPHRPPTALFPTRPPSPFETQVPIPREATFPLSHPLPPASQQQKTRLQQPTPASCLHSTARSPSRRPLEAQRRGVGISAGPGGSWIGRSLDGGGGGSTVEQWGGGGRRRGRAQGRGGR
jgi:hypothetical protein